MSSLASTTHKHHERIERHVDRLPGLAQMIGRGVADGFAADFEAEYRFIVEDLVPHMRTIETTLYGELERLMGKRHSMAPMRREHEELGRLIESLGAYRARVTAGRLSEAEGMVVRRILYRLYSIIKVHLAEEVLYLDVLEHNLSTEEKDVLARAVDHACGEPL